MATEDLGWGDVEGEILYLVVYIVALSHLEIAFVLLPVAAADTQGHLGRL